MLPSKVKVTTDLLKKHQNLDLVFHQRKSWHKNKTKHGKANLTILGNKTLLRYF